MEYQLPRLTRMWTHLERQAGGQVKGMGEKQIEVDKRILRTQVCSDMWLLIDDLISRLLSNAILRRKSFGILAQAVWSHSSNGFFCPVYFIIVVV